MEIVLVLIGIAVVVLVVYLATRKRADELPPPAEEPRLPEAPKAKKRAAAERESGRPAPAPAPKDTQPAPRAAASEPPPRTPEPTPPAAEPPRRVGRLLEERRDPAALRQGLAKSREAGGFFGRLRALFAGKPEISAELTAQIEEVLIGSDVGVATTDTLLARVRESISRGEALDDRRVWQSLREEAVRILEVGGTSGPLELRAKPTVILFVGVNGCGKTTTIGKLATRLKAAGVECVLAAGDTFRAAAVQQLSIWGKRVGCEVVSGKDGADPGSVIFESIKKAQEIGADVVLADTAGRLHTKTNLMGEMTKIAKTAAKALEGAPHEILLVIDATTGQNALAQAREFQQALALTGIVLTKLDGTAKGGVVLGISDALRLPVRLVGLGERPSDLHEFSPEEFVEALLGKESESTAE
ncbi:MAG TPA: signal recognition particle-docking protein FtsY [Polyangiaceae bacterium]|nr:signal recognition particle-docking protein FtsY [Polyangiaceae bacterium]